MSISNLNTISGLWREQVEKHPYDIAVIDQYRTLTFRELDELSCAIANMFPTSYRKGPGFVGIIMDHSADIIAAILAVLKAGMAYVPAEPSFPIDRIRYMMQESDIAFCITNPHYTRTFSDVTEVVVEVPLAFSHDACDNQYDCEVLPSSPAYVLYTSGTTGKPKGVVATNANVAHYVRAFEAEFHPGPGDRMLQYSVCSFDIFVEEVFTTLLNGAALVIPPLDVKDNIHRLFAFCERHGITEISGFPYLLLDFNRLGKLPRDLRLLISGGDVLRYAYIDKLTDRGVMIYNTYGPSETTVCATYQRCDNIPPLADGTYPIGHPVLGTQVMILDENNNEVPDGETGGICIFGDGVTDGYLKEVPESRNFVTLPDGRRMYRSGDLGHVLKDGTFAFSRRNDSQVMILGKRVECGEVENVLNNCPGVAMAVVRASTDPQNLSYLVAYVMPDSNGFSLHHTKLLMARKLAQFMIPEFFVLMREIPLTPNGKPDTNALPIVLKDKSL